MRLTRVRVATSALLVSLTACGGEDGSPESGNSADGRFTLTAPGTATSSTGFVLATGSVVPVALQDFGDSDFYLSATMVIQLRGPDDPVFCPKGSDFGELSAIPAEADGCEWTYADIGGNAVHSESYSAGDGYLVRARAGSLHRLLVVADAVDYGISVTFDVARIAAGGNFRESH